MKGTHPLLGATGVVGFRGSCLSICLFSQKVAAGNTRGCGSWVAKAALDRSGKQGGAKEPQRHCSGGLGKAGSKKKALPNDECWRAELEQS